MTDTVGALRLAMREILKRMQHTEEDRWDAGYNFGLARAHGLLEQIADQVGSVSVIEGEASGPTEQERSAKLLNTKDFSLSDHERDTP